MSVNFPLDGLAFPTRDGPGPIRTSKASLLDSLNIPAVKVRKDAFAGMSARARAARVTSDPALLLASSKLDRDQHRVATSSARTLRVIAPAGSGKTHTMINRVVMQARSSGVDAGRFLMLTFDRSAISSLTSKLAEIQAESGAATRTGSPSIQTLNAFGYRILRENFGHEHKPLAESRQLRWFVRESREVLQTRNPDLAATLPVYVKDRFYLDIFSLLKNQTIDPREDCGEQVADFLLNWSKGLVLFAQPDDENAVTATLSAIVWLFRAQELLMAEARLMDFDDQKLRAYQCLREHDGVLRVIQRRYDEIIVDEFQDINELDFQLIRQVAAESRLVVTGDDDQAIYGFRGCSPRYIMELQEKLQRPFESIELQTNYRCPPNIVAYADQLIRHNDDRIDKQPVAARRDDAPIQVSPTLSAGVEARWVIELIQEVRRSNPTLNFRDFAVLYRMNAQSLPLQIELILADMPYRVRAEHDILQGELLERLLGILRVKLTMERREPFDPADGLNVVRAYFRRDLPRDVADRLFAHLSDYRSSFLDAIHSPRFAVILPKSSEGNFQASVEALPHYAELGKTFEFLAARFNGLKGMVASLEDAIEDDEPLAEINEVAANHPGTVDEFVALMVRARDRAKVLNSGPEDRDAVDLLTYFGAKGRQWHTVVMASCNEAIIPIRQSVQDGTVEEERRLFYVGMTRASHNLVVSYLEKSCNTAVAPSRFLYESGLLSQ